MKATWRKLVHLWSNHKTRVVGVLFALALVVGVGFAASGAVAQTTAPAADASDSWMYEKMLLIVAYIFDAIASFMQKFLVALISGLIWVVSYDAYSNNAVIDVGWPIVRDAINMFVILGLLFIAIKNLIPGQSDNGKTQTQLFSVLVAVILMNFSRTLTLMAVDFSQVVTLTFAQAVADIGAGNFIQLFGIQNHLVVSAEAGDIANGVGSGATFVATGLFKLVMMGATIMAVGIMLVAFLARIILLWFLIILSPAAFFVMGLGNTFPALGEIWSNWEKQFSGLLIFGPILTFFLWLSLAIAAGGDIAATAGFDTSNMVDGSVGLLAAAEPASILSTLVAIVMIFIGIGVAAKEASGSIGVGTIMKFGQDKTEGFIKWSAKKAAYGTAIGAGAGAFAGGAAAYGVMAGAGIGAGSGAYGGYMTADPKEGWKGALKGTAMGAAKGAGIGAVAGYLPGVAALGGVAAVRTARNRGGEVLQGASRALDTKLANVQMVGTDKDATPLATVIGGAMALTGVKAAARGVRQVTSQVSQWADMPDAAAKKAAAERIKNLDSTTVLNDAKMAADKLRNPSLLSAEDLAYNRQLIAKLLSDGDMMKELDPASADRVKRQIFSMSDGDLMGHMDEKEKKAAKESRLKLMAKNLHLLESDEKKTREQKIKDVLNDADFDLKMLSEDALFDGDDPREEVWQVLGRTQGGTWRDKDGNLQVESMATKIANGERGTKKIQAKLLKKYTNKAPEGLTPEELAQFEAQEQRDAQDKALEAMHRYEPDGWRQQSRRQREEAKRLEGEARQRDIDAKRLEAEQKVQAAKQEAAQKAEEDRRERELAKNPFRDGRLADGAKPTPKQVRAAIDNGDLDVQHINDQIVTDYRDAVMGALVGGVAGAKLASLPEGTREQVRQEVTRRQDELADYIAQQERTGGTIESDQRKERAKLREAQFYLGGENGGIAAYMDKGNFRDTDARNEFQEMLARNMTAAVKIPMVQVGNNDVGEMLAGMFNANIALVRKQVLAASRSKQEQQIQQAWGALSRYRAALERSAKVSAKERSSGLVSVGRLAKELEDALPPPAPASP